VLLGAGGPIDAAEIEEERTGLKRDQAAGKTSVVRVRVEGPK
jgi:hypothetical protein